MTGKFRIPMLFAPPAHGRGEREREGGRKSTVNETIEYLMHCAKNSLTIQHEIPLKFGKQSSKDVRDVWCALYTGKMFKSWSKDMA